ncbi:MAG: aspartate aminotransferase family protein [Candidatus Hydrogenedentota bacterium]
MTTDEIRALYDVHIINTYGARRIAMARGEGMKLWDAEGNEYLDFFAGIAVAGVGHCHPKVTKAICDQAQTLVHVSNLYYFEPQALLAALLCENSFADQWFFCNSGAEANEGAIKLARRYWVQLGSPKPVIVTAHASFHGRTMTTLTASGQTKLHDGFDPLMQGFKYANFDDLNDLEKQITPDVGAVLLEPIQGEGGIRTCDPEYLQKVRRLCDDKNVLMILDEIQTGCGRTGRLFAYEHAEIEPDIMTLAKGLGNGIPIGALGCKEPIASGFSVGSHGSTFGGNPLCTAAALATMQVILEEKLADNARDVGSYFLEQLDGLKSKHSSVQEVRGTGLMIGVQMDRAVGDILNAITDKGVICGPAGPDVVRFLPALIVTKEQVDHVVSVFDAVLGEL